MTLLRSIDALTRILGNSIPLGRSPHRSPSLRAWTCYPRAHDQYPHRLYVSTGDLHQALQISRDRGLDCLVPRWTLVTICDHRCELMGVRGSHLSSLSLRIQYRYLAPLLPSSSSIQISPCIQPYRATRGDKLARERIIPSRGFFDCFLLTFSYSIGTSFLSILCLSTKTIDLATGTRSSDRMPSRPYCVPHSSRVVSVMPIS